MPCDPRGTRAWRKLRDRVVAEEPVCWLRYPGRCTYWSTTADHLLTVKARPDLAMERANLRGACQPCNLHRNDTPLEQIVTQTTAEALAFFE